MKSFKFLTQPKSADNMYLCYHMDEVLIHVIRYKQYHNVSIIGIDTPFNVVNVPINGFMRINTWRNYDLNIPQMIEIDYSVIETNTISRNYTYRETTDELLRRLNITGL
jgi:hypothetical protein